MAPRQRRRRPRAFTQVRTLHARGKSFLRKCEADARAKCEAAATGKKLVGAARNSNVEKCVRQTGAPTS